MYYIEFCNFARLQSTTADSGVARFDGTALLEVVEHPGTQTPCTILGPLPAAGDQGVCGGAAGKDLPSWIHSP